MTLIVATHFRTDVNALSESGKISATDGTLRVTDAKDLTIYITIATNFGGSSVNPPNPGLTTKE